MVFHPLGHGVLHHHFFLGDTRSVLPKNLRLCQDQLCLSQNSPAWTSRQCAQMESEKWALVFILLTICVIIMCIIIICITIICIFIIWNHQKQRLQERQHALDAQDRLPVRIPQEHLHEHKSNPGHKILTRSESPWIQSGKQWFSRYLCISCIVEFRSTLPHN